MTDPNDQRGAGTSAQPSISKRREAMVAFAMALFDRPSAVFDPFAPFDIVFPKRADEPFDLSLQECLQAVMDGGAGASQGFIQALSPAHQWMLHFRDEWEESPKSGRIELTDKEAGPLFGQALSSGDMSLAWAKERVAEYGHGGSAWAQIEAFEISKASADDARSAPGPRI